MDEQLPAPEWAQHAHSIVTEWRARTPNGHLIPDASCRELMWEIAFAIRDGRRTELPTIKPEDTP